jgi:uncharacterized membrane protein
MKIKFLIFVTGLIFYLIGFLILSSSNIGLLFIILGIIFMVIIIIPIIINVKNILLLKRRNLKAMNEIFDNFAKGEISRDEYEELKKKFKQ